MQVMWNWQGRHGNRGVFFSVHHTRALKLSNEKASIKSKIFFSSTGKAMKPEFMIIKTWEESETWPYLQANQLGCHSFMDAGNRHKIPGPEVKRCLEESRTASSRSFLVSVVPFFSSPMEVTKSVPGDAAHPVGLYHSWGTLRLGNSSLL